MGGGEEERKRLHIGVTAWDLGPPGTADQLARQAERAEALGLDSFWLPEFHFDEAAPLPQPLLPLAAVAARTRRLRIGTGSYLLPIRHPVQVAEEVAVLDRLSAGRVILGVGRGYRAGLFDAFGVAVEAKRDRFEQALAAMRAAWAGEPVGWEEQEPREAGGGSASPSGRAGGGSASRDPGSAADGPSAGAHGSRERGPRARDPGSASVGPSGTREGRNAGREGDGKRGDAGIEVDAAIEAAAGGGPEDGARGAGGRGSEPSRGRPVRLVPRPVQAPHPPIWIAAFGPRALDQAGRLGLPYFASPIESMEALDRNFARFREAWAAAARTAPPAATPIMRTTFISRDRARLRAARERLAEQAASLARSPVGAIRRGAGVRPDDWALVGEPEAVRDRIEACRERFAMTHLVASRTRLPGLEPGDFERSLDHLAALRESLDGASPRGPPRPRVTP